MVVDLYYYVGYAYNIQLKDKIIVWTLDIYSNSN